MKDNKDIMKSNESIKGNTISDGSEVRTNHDLNPIRDDGPLDFEINKEFIHENINTKPDLVKPRHKFSPFTKVERRNRRTEVYKLHFEHGMPATRIAVVMKVDRNTINNDLKFLYRKALSDYNLDNMSLDDILEKQLVRLEAQRDRLGIYLNDAKDVTSKVTIERLIADIDFRILTAVDKINHNTTQFYDQIIKAVNNIAENKKLDIRFTSLYELREISIDSRISLNKLKEDTLNRTGR